MDINDIRTGWRLITSNDIVEDYDSSGRLLSISTREGVSQTLSYTDNTTTITDVQTGESLFLQFDSSSGQLVLITAPHGGVYTYSYDVSGNLYSVTYPDNTSNDSLDNPKTIYHYNEPALTGGANFPHALTGITDERGLR